MLSDSILSPSNTELGAVPDARGSSRGATRVEPKTHAAVSQDRPSLPPSPPRHHQGQEDAAVSTAVSETRRLADTRSSRQLRISHACGGIAGVPPPELPASYHGLTA